MSGPIVLDATLYEWGSTAAALADGYGVKTRHDACLEVVDGTVHATKFGISPAGAIKNTINNHRRREAEHDTTFIDSTEQCTLKLFSGGNDYHIPTTLQGSIHLGGEGEYRLVDTQNVTFGVWLGVFVLLLVTTVGPTYGYVRYHR